MQPDFEKLSELLASQDVFQSVSEVHGIISGQVSADMPGYNPQLTWELLGMESEAGAVMLDLLLRLKKSIVGDLEGSDFPFHPLLPGDDEALGLRLVALSRWCEGFNAGFGAACKKPDSALQEETREVVGDFAAIATMEEQPEAGDEQDEKDFMEIVEYVRMAATTVFLQNNRKAAPGPAPDENTQIH